MRYFLLMLVSSVFTLSYASNFKGYYNTRFNYQIKYPAFLTAQGESENSDGQVFKAKDIELRVWGGYFPDTIDESFTSAKKELKDYDITHEVKRNNAYVLSGEHNNRIIYLKTIYVCDENINMRLYYPKREKDKWVPLVDEIVSSFKFLGNCKKT